MTDASYTRLALASEVASLEEQLRRSSERRTLLAEQIDAMIAEQNKLREILRNYERDVVPKIRELMDRIQERDGRT